MSTRKVALVTGAATGIGRACAIRFADQGLAVLVNYSRSESEANETAAMVKERGVPVLIHRANVGDDEAVREMVRRCEEELGGVDVVVNNAGTTHFVDLADLDGLTDAIWDEILQVNLKGTFYVCRAAMPALLARSGCIVNITSVAGIHGQGSSIPYSASKAALNCLTKSLAQAFGPTVRVNAVAPGPVQTRWLADHQDRVERYIEVAPMKRAAEPDDIADSVEFLALRAPLTTGQVLVVDGGRTM